MAFLPWGVTLPCRVGRRAWRMDGGGWRSRWRSSFAKAAKRATGDAAPTELEFIFRFVSLLQLFRACGAGNCGIAIPLGLQSGCQKIVSNGALSPGSTRRRPHSSFIPAKKVGWWRGGWVGVWVRPGVQRRRRQHTRTMARRRRWNREKIKPVRRQALVSPPSPCVTNPGTFYAIAETCRIAFDFHLFKECRPQPKRTS